jgi:hypothetical protein
MHHARHDRQFLPAMRKLVRESLTPDSASILTSTLLMPPICHPQSFDMSLTYLATKSNNQRPNTVKFCRSLCSAHACY